jgi:hypothetical protein
LGEFEAIANRDCQLVPFPLGKHVLLAWSEQRPLLKGLFKESQAHGNRRAVPREDKELFQMRRCLLLAFRILMEIQSMQTVTSHFFGIRPWPDMT